MKSAVIHIEKSKKKKLYMDDSQNENLIYIIEYGTKKDRNQVHGKSNEAKKKR